MLKFRIDRRIRSNDITAMIKQLRCIDNNDRRVMCSHLSMDISVISAVVNDDKYVPEDSEIHLAKRRNGSCLEVSWVCLNKSTQLQRRKVGLLVLYKDR